MASGVLVALVLFWLGVDDGPRIDSPAAAKGWAVMYVLLLAMLLVSAWRRGWRRAK